MTKLFVGQVPAICSEDQLSAIFGQFGDILDISIMRDKTTGRSKGSAWVVFQDAAAAEDAIATLHDKHSIPPQSNSLQIRYAGKPPGVTVPPQQQQQQPQQQGQVVSPHAMPRVSPPVNSINTPPNMNMPQDAQPPFLQQQHVPQSRFHPQQQQQHPQHHPHHHQQQQRQQQHPATGIPLSGMMAKMDPAGLDQQHQGNISPQWGGPAGVTNNNIQPGAAGEVDEDGSPKKRADKKYPPCGGRKLFVGQLPKDMTREDVRKLMVDYGVIEELHVMTDKRTGQGTGAAFVIFEKRSDAQRAISELNGVVTITGMKCPMQVRFAEGELDKNQDGKLFVGQVPYAANEEDLKRLFGPFGDLTEVALVRKGGQSKGCGFVRFTDRLNADDAIEALNGRHTMVGGHSPLTVRFADSEEEKRRRREDRHTQQMQNMMAQMQISQPQQNQQVMHPVMGLGMMQGIVGGLGLYSPVLSQ